MEVPEQTTPKAKRLKIVIILLAVLLVLSGGGLAARFIYLHFLSPVQTTVAVPDNLIGEETENSSEEIPVVSEEAESSLSIERDKSGSRDETSGAGGNESNSSAADKPQAAKLELYAGRPDANQKFEVNNMLPGDTEPRYFCVRAHHNADIELFFRSDVTEQTKLLGDALRIQVTHLDSGKVLCDAPFAEIDGKEVSEVLTANAQGETIAYYRIDVSLDTSAGNEYQAAMLQADFQWYVEDEDGLTPPPQTGDTTNLILWITLAASSLLLILLLLLTRRRKEEGQHE